MAVVSQARKLRSEIRKLEASNAELTATSGAILAVLVPLMDRYPDGGSKTERARWADEVHAAMTATSREG
jgi:hypothetical protein